MGLAARIHEATPADRDRYLDALRVGSILLVILGHWLVRAVTETEGELDPGYMLALVPETQWATLIVQVLPVFFFVGGALNAASYRRARARGEPAIHWLQHRARRLLRPALPLIALWVPVALVAEIASGRDPFVFGADTALTPLWFLAAYAVVTALVPLTLHLHDKGQSAALFALGAAVTVAIDALRFEIWPHGPSLGGQPAVAALNYPIVFALIHQLGYLWEDGALPRRRWAQLLWTAVSAGVLAILIAGAYPLSMVPISGENAPNNLAPPSAALIALGGAQLGLALLFAPAARRLLRRPRAWAAVALPGGRLMTLYLWHQGAMLLAAATFVSIGGAFAPDAIDASWWASRPAWLAACAAFLLPLAALFARFEPPAPIATPAPPGRSGAWIYAGGLALAAAGLASLAGGVPAPSAGPLAVAGPITALLAGFLALGVIGHRLLARFFSRGAPAWAPGRPARGPERCASHPADANAGLPGRAAIE